MSAIPHSNLWIPGERFRNSLARKRNWLRRLRAPWVNFTGEDYVDATTGKLVVDATTGKQEVNSGSGNGCCLYQARDCATNTLQSLYVKKSQFPSFPSTYYFKTAGGTCMYAQASDVAPCNSTPLVTGETGYASCAACSGCGCCSALGGTASSAFLVTFSGVTNAACCTGSGPRYWNAVGNLNGTYSVPFNSGGTGGCFYATDSSHAPPIVTVEPTIASSCSNPGTTFIIEVEQVAAAGTCPAGWQVAVETIFTGTPVFLFAAWLDGNGIWDTDCTASRTFTNVVTQCVLSSFPTCGASYQRGAASGGTAVVTPC